MQLSDYILYEDGEVLAVHKPAGLVVHPDGKARFETLSDLILRDRPEMKDIGEPLQVGEKVILRPGIVHRLDKETSGVMIITKTQAAFLFLKSSFAEREVEKVYHAFTYGAIKNSEGIIDTPIGRSSGDIRKWAVARGARGELREAVTEYTVLAKIGLPEGKEGGSTEPGTYSYIEARPKTGRTHQIRVHMRSINHPIICDTLYAPGREGALGFSRLALHAYSLTLSLPSGEKKTFIAPFPEDFKNARTLAGVETLC
jgi:23S rRNA pseudouridine1911/1915/1917 synthase